MKILVTGARGQLGHDVAAELNRRGHQVTGVDIEEMDITDDAFVQRVIRETRPEGIIHCAAWTAVDAAEEEENRERVMAINAAGTRSIAAVCKELDIPLLYLSTDYVFDGRGDAPWRPDETSYAPLNVYGESKLAGERAVTELLSRYFIVRIAWVFGVNGNNFIKTMLRVGADHDTVTVVNDQIGTPTYTYDLARFLADLIESDQYGIYHATNEGGYISWYDFACEIFRQAADMGHSCYDERHLTVKPVTTAEYGLSKAARPFNSRLDKSRIAERGFTPLPPWQDALQRYLHEIDLGKEE